MATTKGASFFLPSLAPTRRVPPEVLLLFVTSSYSYSSPSSPALKPTLNYSYWFLSINYMQSHSILSINNKVSKFHTKVPTRRSIKFIKVSIGLFVSSHFKVTFSFCFVFCYGWMVAYSQVSSSWMQMLWWEHLNMSELRQCNAMWIHICNIVMLDHSYLKASLFN